MSSALLFTAAIICPIALMTVSLPVARKVGLWPFTFFAVLICWALTVLAVNAGWDEAFYAAISRHASDAEMQAASADGANMVFTLLFGWLPALVYCGSWHWFLKVALLRKPIATSQVADVRYSDPV